MIIMIALLIVVYLQLAVSIVLLDVMTTISVQLIHVKKLVDVFILLLTVTIMIPVLLTVAINSLDVPTPPKTAMIKTLAL
jgi:hypothetical protein